MHTQHRQHGQHVRQKHLHIGAVGLTERGLGPVLFVLYIQRHALGLLGQANQVGL